MLNLMYFGIVAHCRGEVSGVHTCNTAAQHFTAYSKTGTLRVLSPYTCGICASVSEISDQRIGCV